MADNELQVRLLHAAKTQDQWKAVTSYPKKGEVCLEAINSSGATAFKIKIGDGTRPYCQNTAPEGETPVWDFTSDQVLPYFGSVIETSGTVNVVAISTYDTTKKKLSFYTLGLSATTVGGSTTITPTIASSPYLEIIEGDGVEFTTDETGTVKEFYINLAATTEATATTITDGGTFTTITPDSNHKATKYTTFTLPSIADAIAELDTDSPLALVEYDSATTTLSIYTISETDGVISKSSTAATTIDLSGVAPVQDVQINSTSILDNSGNANLAVEGTYNASSNKIATESTVSDAVEGLDVNGYAQAEIDTTTTSGQTTLTIKGIEEVNGEIAVDTTNNTSIVIDGTYNASTNKIATESTVSDVIATLDGNATTTDITSSHDVIVSVSETDGIVSSAKKTLVAGNKIDIDIPTTGTSIGDIIISHEDIDTTATDVASNITTDTSSVIDEKELSVITGIKVDAQGHITHIDKDVSTNLVAADIKSPVEMIDDEMWTYRTTGGDITIDKDIANVTTVKGKSLVWNQLIALNPSINDSGLAGEIALTKSGYSYTLNGTTTANRNMMIYSTNPIVGHKVFYSIAKDFAGVFIGDGYSSSVPGKGKFIKTAQTNSIYINISNGSTLNNVTIWPNIIDLTLMFGAGNEPSTVAEFEALYPLDYYDYNACTLINNNASAIESTGFNQWDEEFEEGAYDSTTGEKTVSTNYRTKNYIPCFPNTAYYFYTQNVSTGFGYLFFYDAQKNYLGIKFGSPNVRNKEFTTPQGAYYMAFWAGLSVFENDICINISDHAKNGTYEPYEKHTFYFDKVLQSSGSLATVTGKLNGVGESVVVFPDGLKSAGSVFDEIKGNVAIKRIGSRAYTSGDESDTTVITDGTNTYYALTTPETYILDQTVTGNYIVDDNGTEKLLPEGVDSTTGLPLTTPFSGIITYQSNFKNVVLDTVDKVSKYKNPVRSKEDKPQTTGKVAVYDSDSTVKSSTFAISNTAIDPEGTSNETTVPTIDAVVDYIEDVVDTEVTVQDITTTDDDVSGNGGIRITNTGTTYDVHHADITQSADVTHTITPEEGDNNEAVVKLVTGVITDDFGHVKGKEVISSDKLIAADIKAPMTFTDKDTWLIRPTAGSHDVISEDIARITELEGNSCVWNQLVDSDTTSVTLMSGRKYYTKIDGTAAVISGAGSAVSVTGGTDTVIDLTLLGIDNLTTTNQVEEWLAQHVGTKPYYAYNAGTILSAQTLGIKTYGQNLLNPTTKQAKLIPYEWEDNSNVYTIKNVPSGATATFTPDATGVAETVDISGGSLDITSYGSGILELSAATADTYVCMKWDEQKDDEVVPFEEYTQDFDVRKVYGKVNGTGEYVQCFPNGIRSAGSVHDTLTASEAVVKVDSVNLGTFNWYRDVEHWGANIFYTIIDNLGQKTSNLICSKYVTNGNISALSMPDKSIGANSGGIATLLIKDTTYSIPSDFKTAMRGVLLNYKLNTPITYTDLIYRDGGVDRSLSDILVNINVNNWSIEEQLLTPYVDGNPTSTAATITMQYKSNFKDAIKDLIDKVNNQKNPVMGVSNTGQTVDKIAIYDSASTVHSSSYSPSNADVVPDSAGNMYLLPTVKVLVDYVNSVLSSALTYQSTVATEAQLHSKELEASTGDLYIASATIVVNNDPESTVLPNGTYYPGTFFIWNEVNEPKWDVVPSTTTVVNNDLTINFNDASIAQEIGTVDGTPLTIKAPNLNFSDPTASSTGSLTFIDSVSQTNGLISATKKPVRSASTTQSGVVVLSTGIEDTTTEDSKVQTAYDTLINLNSRDVGANTLNTTVSNTPSDTAVLHKRLIDTDSTSQTYGHYINKDFSPITKFSAINDFSTGFSTAYPDLAAIEALGSSSPTSGFPKRASDGTWSLDQNVLTKYLAPIASPGTDYTFSDPSSNDVLENLIHDYYTGGDYTNKIVTKVKKASLTNTKGFAIDVPILSSTSATAGTVLKGVRTDNNTGLPIWANLSIEELSELNNLSSNTGYLKRASSGTGYTWSLDTPVSTTVTSVHSDQTPISSSTASAGIKVTTNGDTTYHKISVSALINDTVDTLILNGNFS